MQGKHEVSCYQVGPMCCQVGPMCQWSELKQSWYHSGCWDITSGQWLKRQVRPRGYKVMQTPCLVSFGKGMQYDGTCLLPLVYPHH